MTKHVIHNPRDVREAQALIRRLCELQAFVAREVIGYDHAADCFCGEQGYWPLSSPDEFQNEGLAVDFIEAATRAAVMAHVNAHEVA